MPPHAVLVRGGFRPEVHLSTLEAALATVAAAAQLPRGSASSPAERGERGDGEGAPAEADGAREGAPGEAQLDETVREKWIHVARWAQRDSAAAAVSDDGLRSANLKTESVSSTLEAATEALRAAEERAASLAQSFALAQTEAADERRRAKAAASAAAATAASLSDALAAAQRAAESGAARAAAAERRAAQSAAAASRLRAGAESAEAAREVERAHARRELDAAWTELASVRDQQREAALEAALPPPPPPPPIPPACTQCALQRVQLLSALDAAERSPCLHLTPQLLFNRE